MASILASSVSASSLAKRLGCELQGMDARIDRVGGLSEASDGVLTFCKGGLGTSFSGGAVIISPRSIGERPSQVTVLVSDRPRLDFIRALQELEADPGFARDSSPPIIHPSARIAPSAIIEPGCRIEQGVVIEHNVVVYSGTSIGRDSRVNAGAVIGRDGFGFERDEDGILRKFIHLGGVHIGRNVEIGCNACVSRGALGTTTIEDGVKIDALVYVAHNCHIEADAIVIASAELSGGVRIGRRAWVGPNASVMQKVSIGADCLVGIGAVVIKDVPAGSVVAGNPARTLRVIAPYNAP